MSVWPLLDYEKYLMKLAICVLKCTIHHQQASLLNYVRLHFLHFLWLSLMHLIFSCLWVVSSCKKRFQSTTQQSTNAFGQKSSCPYRSLNTFNVLSIHSKCNETWSLLPTLWVEIAKKSYFLRSTFVLAFLKKCENSFEFVYLYCSRQL